MREAANGSGVEALIESWETARVKEESGQQDIKRRSAGDGGSQWRSGVSTCTERATGKASTRFISHFALLQAELKPLCRRTT